MLFEVVPIPALHSTTHRDRNHLGMTWPSTLSRGATPCGITFHVTINSVTMTWRRDYYILWNIYRII